MSLSKIVEVPNTNGKYTLHVFHNDNELDAIHQPKVWSVKRNKYVKPRLDSKKRYFRINLGSASNCWPFHKLVAECCQIPNPSNLPVLDHINRNKRDNRPENLRWVSHSDNAKNVGPATRTVAIQTTN